MTTLSSFRTEVSAVLGLDNSASADQPLIDGWLNEGLSDILVRTECKVLQGTMTLTAGSNNYTLPTGILSIIEMTVSSGTTTYSLERVTPAEIIAARRVGTASTSPIRIYAVDGSNMLMVYPTPTASDTLTLIYVPRPTALSATSDEPSEVPSEWHKLLTFYALFRGADYDDDASSQMGERYRGLYEVGLRQMRKALYRKGGHHLPRFSVNRRRRKLVRPADRSADY